MALDHAYQGFFWHESTKTQGIFCKTQGKFWQNSSKLLKNSNQNVKNTKYLLKSPKIWVKFAQILSKIVKTQGFFVKTQADGKSSNFGCRKSVQKKPWLKRKERDLKKNHACGAVRF